MRPVRAIAAAFAAVLLALSVLPASAKLLIEIDKSAQRMVVSQDGAQIYVWPVSTGVSSYDTPAGNFTPFRMERDHFSREWDNAPMPNSIFFTQRGHAIHGTSHSSIGRPASHGCVRLSVENSRVLFDLVKREGMPNTKVVLFGEIPRGSAPGMVQRDRSWDQESGEPQYYRYGDRDVTGSAPPARRVYRGRYPDGTPVYSDDVPYRRPPQPFFLPGSQSPWN